MTQSEKRRQDASRLPAGAEWWAPVQGAELTGECVGVLEGTEPHTGRPAPVALVRPDGTDRIVALGRSVSLAPIVATVRPGDRLRAQYRGWQMNAKGRMSRDYRVMVAQRKAVEDGE